MIAAPHPASIKVPIAIIGTLIGGGVLLVPGMYGFGILILIVVWGFVLIGNAPTKRHPGETIPNEPAGCYYYVSDPADPQQWLAEVDGHTLILYKEGSTTPYGSTNINEVADDLASFSALHPDIGTPPYYLLRLAENCYGLLVNV